MSGRNNMILVLFKVLECVVWTSKKELSTFNVTRIPRDLKPIPIRVNLSRNASRTSAQKSALIPVPKQDLPVWGPSQSYKNLFFSNAESTTNEFLRFVFVHLIDRIWESLPLFGAYHFKNSDQTFLVFYIALTYTNVASTI
jgi:hypothetical protein